MATDQPGAIEPHPRLKPKGRSAAENGRPETFLFSARNAVGRGPRVLRGVVRQGKKVARPPLRSDDRGAAGLRPNSPIRGPRGALRSSPETWRQQAAGYKSMNALSAERLAMARQWRRSRFAHPWHQTQHARGWRRINGDQSGLRSAPLPCRRARSTSGRRRRSCRTHRWRRQSGQPHLGKHCHRHRRSTVEERDRRKPLKIAHP